MVNHSTRVTTLIEAADCERWLSWYGPASERAAHATEADRLIEELRRVGVDWAEEVGR